MTRISQKKIINNTVGGTTSIQTQFDKGQADATIRDRGISVRFQKSYLCPCKSKESDHRNTCKTCAGVGIFWANPMETEMIISGIATEKSNMNDYGLLDLGMVRVTATNNFKFGRMDSIEIIDATSELSEVKYLNLNDEQTNTFIFTKYTIVSIDYVALYVSEDQKLLRLTEGNGDYTFHDNVLELDPKYNNRADDGITIRYVYKPLFYILGIARESFTSTQGVLADGQSKLILPIHAIAQRAHLVKDVENYDGDALLDNSWLPSCINGDTFTKFQRQLRYTDPEIIFEDLTSAQKIALKSLLDGFIELETIDGNIELE